VRRAASAATAVLIATLVLVAAGCGGDDESSGSTETATWAADFCTAVTTWKDERERIANEFDDPSALSADSIRQAVEDMDAATQTFVDDVRALGSPETESGQDAEDSVETLADTFETERTDIQDSVEDVSSFSDIPAAISAIGTSLTAMSDALGNTIRAVDNVSGELKQAFQDADECDDLGD
jgi:hypothetical protein